MKRGLSSLLLVFFLLLPFATATIIIDGPEQNNYNLGDSLEISGYIWEDKDVEGFLSTKIVCGDTERLLQLVPLQLQKEQQLFFPEDIELPQITFAGDLIGQCTVHLSVLEGFQELDTDTSKTFTVVKDLDGTFKLEESTLQVGSNFQLEGKIYQKDGDPVTGTAELYFDYKGTQYLINVAPITEGDFSFTHTTKATPGGTYQVDVVARDTFGNAMEFKDVTTFTLVKELTSSADTDDTEYLPGATVLVSGEVTNVHFENVEEATAEITLDASTTVVPVKDGIYNTEIALSQSITGGQHTLIIKIKDQFGNIGKNQLSFNVESVPTRIENDFLESSYLPGEVLTLTPYLYDQAEDPLDENIVVEIIDTNENLRLSKTVPANEKILLRVPQYATPGVWTVRSHYLGVSSEDTIAIKEYNHITVTLEGTLLTITNTGNVKHKNDISVHLQSDQEEFTIKHKETIKPNGTILIYLQDEVPSGDYLVSIPLLDGTTEQFEHVIIENGKPVRSFNGIYILLLLTVIGIVVYFTFTKGNESKPRKLRDRHSSRPHKKKKLVNLRKPLEEQKSKEHEKKRDLKDFKERILKEIKKTEAKTSRGMHSKKGEMYPGNDDKPKNNETEQSGFANLFG